MQRSIDLVVRCGLQNSVLLVHGAAPCLDTEKGVMGKPADPGSGKQQSCD